MSDDAGSPHLCDTAADREVSVRIYLPDPALTAHITFYYFVELPGPLADFLFPEWGNIRFALSGDWIVENGPSETPFQPKCLLFGPTDRRADIRTTGGKMVGFGLTPLGWDRLIGEDAYLLANNYRVLGRELDVDPAKLREQLRSDTNDQAGVERFDQILLRLLANRPPNDPIILKIDEVLRSRPDNVEAFAGEVGVSSRTLRRLCLNAFGFGPKILLRRQRFLDALGRIRIASQVSFLNLLTKPIMTRRSSITISAISCTCPPANISSIRGPSWEQRNRSRPAPASRFLSNCRPSPTRWADLPCPFAGQFQCDLNLSVLTISMRSRGDISSA